MRRHAAGRMRRLRAVDATARPRRPGIPSPPSRAPAACRVRSSEKAVNLSRVSRASILETPPVLTGDNSHGLSVGQDSRRPLGCVVTIAGIRGKPSACTFANSKLPAAFQANRASTIESQSDKDDVRHSDELPGDSVFRLSCRAMAFWCAMGKERRLDQHSVCRRHPARPVSGLVHGFMRRLWAGRDRHLCAGADLDCCGSADDRFGGARSLQIRALIPQDREGAEVTIRRYRPSPMT